jgi:hydroxymethylglutaryl-CoA reductase
VTRTTSRIAGFYNLSLEERRNLLAAHFGVSKAALEIFSGEAGLDPGTANYMIENVIGIHSLPLGIATNFLVNRREVLVPMAIEEPSVVAGASYMAKLARAGGGFKAIASKSHMIAQMQVLNVEDLELAKEKLISQKLEILERALLADPVLSDLGGGPRDLEVRIFEDTPAGPMLVVHLIIDTLDAMGANASNTTAEVVRPLIEQITGGRVHLKIISNLADQRLANARCTIPVDELTFGEYDGKTVRDGIIEAWAFAYVDPYRAATHNKGIMNGIDAVVIATGNDWRAVEAGAHAYAAREGHYTSLSEWRVGENGDLLGELTLPLALGIVGGATRVHPGAKASLKLMGVDRVQDLAEIIVSVGLAQNLAALRALATEGIQRGHMNLHARQVAIAAGAQGKNIGSLAERLVEDGIINVEHARKLLTAVDNSE